VIADIWSTEGVGGIDGAGGTVDWLGIDNEAPLVGCVWAGAGVTAAAAAAAYRTGRGAGRATGLSRPAFSILDIGFCSKFGGGGGFTT
jgi:hypothetical protein